jgi:threonine dehydrogenase-like Zn-dependent dehydrogenase
MRALTLNDGVELRNIDAPSRERHEALVQVRLAGVCATDLELARGYMGFRGVLGHEFVGEVVASPNARWIGRRVVGEINVGCGSCARCKAGLSRHCDTRSVLGIKAKDGCFAEYLTLPLDNLIEVPAQVPDEMAVFTEPLAAAFEILEQVHIGPNSRALVLGDGRLGLLCAMVLAHIGCDTHMLGRHEAKLAIARAHGVRTFALPDGPLHTYGVVVEATGNPEGLARAIELTEPRGTLVLKTTQRESPALDLNQVVIREISLVGSRCGPFGPALRAMASGRIDPRPLIHERFDLEEGVRALARAGEPGVLKVLLQMS